MSTRTLPVLGFAAFSGTGKTSLLIELIPILKRRGLKIGVIKHSHHDFEIDYPGKDSFRLRKSGATPVMIASPFRRVVITEFAEPVELDLHQHLAAFPADNLDLLLVEGFRNDDFAKIELHRPSLSKPLLYPDDPNIIAVASDTPLPTPAHVANLDLNHPAAIADFIVAYLPRLNFD